MHSCSLSLFPVQNFVTCLHFTDRHLQTSALKYHMAKITPINKMALLQQHCCNNAETPASKCVLAAFFQCSILVACLHFTDRHLQTSALKSHMAKITPIIKMVLLQQKSDVLSAVKMQKHLQSNAYL